MTALIAVFALPLVAQQASEKSCHIEATSFHGWSAQQLANNWVNLTFAADFAVSRVSLHLLGDDGRDWGMIDEADVRGDQ